MTRVAVIGAGSWGTAVAGIAATNTSTILWARSELVAEEIASRHSNERYLPGSALPDALEATHELNRAVDSADVIVMGVPSHGFRSILESMASSVTPGVPVISLTKGVEQGTLKRMTELIAEALPDNPAGVLTGPNLAREVAAGQPAASVIAIADHEVAARLQPLFTSPTFRVYTNPDVIGAEVAGALKNVMAIAAGMADGMGLGDNAKASMITRGLAELTRLGVALGGQPLTFSGLAGVGDLVATCMSRQSRNRHVGEELGKGRSVQEIIAEMNMVAEGVKTSRAVVDLARERNVEMPIAEQVVAVIEEGRRPADALLSLMSRTPKDELHGILPELQAVILILTAPEAIDVAATGVARPVLLDGAGRTPSDETADVVFTGVESARLVAAVDARTGVGGLEDRLFPGFEGDRPAGDVSLTGATIRVVPGPPLGPTRRNDGEVTRIVGVVLQGVLAVVAGDALPARCLRCSCK